MLKNNKGVTLIELLIVIIILGIIAAISTVAVGNIIENAQKDAVLADAITLTGAANLYCAQHLTAEACTGNGIFTNTENPAAIAAEPAGWALAAPNLSEYLTSFPEGSIYAVWLEAGVWHVALITDEYSFNAGSPVDADRSNVQDGTAAWADQAVAPN